MAPKTSHCLTVELRMWNISVLSFFCHRIQSLPSSQNQAWVLKLKLFGGDNSQIFPGNKYSFIYSSESGTVNSNQVAPPTARSRQLSYLSLILQTTLGFSFPLLAQLSCWSLPLLLLLSVLDRWRNGVITAYRTNDPATPRPHMTRRLAPLKSCWFDQLI